VSFPVTLRVSFDTDDAGNVAGLSWHESGASSLTASRIPTREERLTFRNRTITIGGTLILPEGKGPFRVVVITPGDFGTNRDQLRLWAHDYVGRGIAALVFDSRGAGESTGPVSSSSFPDLAGDVLAIVDALKTRTDIDPHQIGLFGFSNSSWTVSLAASRSRDVGFLILQSLPGVPPWKQDIYRAETQLRVDKFPDEVVKQGAEFTRKKFEVARTGTGWEEIEQIMEKARGERWIAYTNPPRTLERLRQVYETTMTYDPVPALESLRTPVLAYWGENDTYVPVAESISIFKQAMAKAGNTNYVVRVYPKCQHDLIEGSGSPIAGATSLKFPAGFWAMKADWVLQH
jgi:pimeloyl-ACP methyl ester carboxylesterase